ncbi:TPA: hypothetical protein ACX3GO_002661 [Vibrio parahaemolyticus]
MLNSLISLLYSISIFITLNPFFTWSNSWVKVIIYLIPVVFSFVFKKIKSHQDRDILYYFLICSSFSIYIYLPIRELDDINLGFFGMILPLFVLFCSRDIQSKTLNHLANIFALISVISLFSLITHSLNINLWSFNVSQDFRRASSNLEQYVFFNGSLYLNTLQYKIMNLELYRMIGWFKEPSHYAIALSFIISFYDFKKKWMLWVLVFNLFLTFSLSGYIMMIMFYIIKHLDLKGVLKIVFLVILSVILLSLPALEPVMNTYVWAKVEGKDLLEILFSRAESTYTIPEISLYEFMFGFGRYFTQEFEIIISDFRAAFFRYGLLYFLFIFLHFIQVRFLCFKSYNKYYKVYILLMIAIISHRVWIIESIFYMALFILCYITYGKEVNERKSIGF